MLRHSNSNNEIVIGDFNSFRPLGDTLYSLCVVSPIAVKYVLSDKLVIFHGVQND